jgi:hypothetical protein
VAVQNSGFCPSMLEVRCSYENDPRIRGFEGLKKRTSNIERPTSNVEWKNSKPPTNAINTTNSTNQPIGPIKRSFPTNQTNRTNRTNWTDLFQPITLWFTFLWGLIQRLDTYSL